MQSLPDSFSGSNGFDLSCFDHRFLSCVGVLWAVGTVVGGLCLGIVASLQLTASGLNRPVRTFACRNAGIDSLVGWVVYRLVSIGSISGVRI